MHNHHILPILKSGILGKLYRLTLTVALAWDSGMQALHPNPATVIDPAARAHQSPGNEAC